MALVPKLPMLTVSSLLTLVGRSAAATQMLVHRLAYGARVVAAEVHLTMRDLGFSLWVLLVSLAHLGMFVVPGVLMLVAGVVNGWPMLGAGGGLWCLGVAVAAVAGAEAVSVPGPDHVLWARYFPPTWMENHGLVACLMPLVQSANGLDLRVARALRSERNRDFSRMLGELRRAMRARMHALRPIARQAMRRKALEPVVSVTEGTGAAVATASETLDTYEQLIAGPATEEARDQLGEAVARLAAAVEELRRIR